MTASNVILSIVTTSKLIWSMYNHQSIRPTAWPTTPCNLNRHPTVVTNFPNILLLERFVNKPSFPERITPSWSSRHCLLWPQKGILRSFGRETKLCESIGDISVVMQDRAQQGCYTSKVSKKTLQPILDPPILSGQCKAVTWPLIRIKILHLFIIPNTASALAHRLLGCEYLSVLWVVLEDNYFYVQSFVPRFSTVDNCKYYGFLSIEGLHS